MTARRGAPRPGGTVLASRIASFLGVHRGSMRLDLLRPELDPAFTVSLVSYVLEFFAVEILFGARGGLGRTVDAAADIATVLPHGMLRKDGG